ncbi:MAG: hypothetical protein AB7K24_18930, partial [Gemmataceae bacterium]
MRQPTECEVSCRTVSNILDRAWPSQIEDISCGGLKLLAGRRFESGTLLKIEWPAGRGTELLAM